MARKQRFFRAPTGEEWAVDADDLTEGARAKFPKGTREIEALTEVVLPPPPTASVSEFPPLDPAKWSYLRNMDGGRMGRIIDAAKKAMPAGNMKVLFESIVDNSPAVSIKTVKDITKQVRAMGKVPDVPTDEEIEAAWTDALDATPARLEAAMERLTT